MRNTERKFWNKVEKCSDGHWYFRGYITKKGYGQMRLAGKMQLAHRLAFYFTYGSWPNEVLDHKCRVKHCVNPSHLEDTTNQINSQRGNNAILNPQKVTDIKLCLDVGFKHVLIAQMFKVSKPTIDRISNRSTWNNT